MRRATQKVSEDFQKVLPEIPKKKEKLTRAQKTEQIKAALFQAAAKVVGEYGYLNAMIQTITSRASVANGTFYNYFETRQDLFDQLLPNLGRQMLSFIGERSQIGDDEVDRERKRLVAFFQFLQERPEFYRILYEAEVFAPAAFDEHMALVKKRYVALLERALKSGQITGYSSRELEVIVLILMGARQYMAMAYRGRKVPPSAVDTYVRFIAGGFHALGSETKNTRSSASADKGEGKPSRGRPRGSQTKVKANA